MHISCHLQGDVKQQVVNHNHAALPPPSTAALPSPRLLGESPHPSLILLWPLPQTHEMPFLSTSALSVPLSPGHGLVLSRRDNEVPFQPVVRAP